MNLRAIKYRSVIVLIIYLQVFLFFHNINAQETFPAAEFIKQKFGEYNIIALDEGPHGTLQAHRFLRQLIQELDTTVQYIILEFLNTSYQETLDKYMNGEDVPIEELRLLWRENTQAHSTNFEKPVYMKLLEEIRSMNSKFSPDKRIRVIAGDPVIDWTKIYTTNDYFSALTQRDIFPSELAIQFGIDSGKNVLMIYGGEHLGKLSNDKKDSTFWTIPYYINKNHPGSIYSIGIFKSENYPAYTPGFELNSVTDLTTSSAGDLTDNGNKLKDKFDAVYYIGPSTQWQEDTAPRIDSAYWNILNRRAVIVWGQGLGVEEMEGK